MTLVCLDEMLGITPGQGLTRKHNQDKKGQDQELNNGHSLGKEEPLKTLESYKVPHILLVHKHPKTNKKEAVEYCQHRFVVYFKEI